MSFSPYDPVGMFDAEVPTDVLRTFAVAIIKSYTDTEQYFKNAEFGSAERHDLLPHHRRALVENRVRFAGNRFPQVHVESRLNSANNAYHNVFDIGRVSLTVHMVSRPGDMVREATYRNDYAQDCQGNLFSVVTAPKGDGRLYGFVLHTPDSALLDGNAAATRRVMNRPAALEIRFPDAACKKYLEGEIDLYDRFSDLRPRMTDLESVPEP